VIDFRQNRNLALEHFPIVLTSEVIRDNFDRHNPSVARIPRRINHSESTAPNVFDLCEVRQPNP
jgi:hypothetical protein